MLPPMSRASTVGKVAVLASSILLGGTYISSQAGWVRLPFISEKRPRAIMSSSKVRAIGPVLTSRFFDPPPYAVTQPEANPTAMMVSSKSGAVYPLRLSPLAQQAAANSGSIGISPDLTRTPAPILTSNAMPGPAPVAAWGTPGKWGTLSNGSGSVVAAFKSPLSGPTTQPLLPAKVPSMNGTVPSNR